jgi:Effector protein
VGNDDPDRGSGSTRASGAGPLRHVPPFHIGDTFKPSILKALHEKEITELINRAMAKDSRLSISWWWLEPRRPASSKEIQAANAHRQALEKETRRMLDELAHTEAGFKLLTDLVNAYPRWVTVANGNRPRNNTDIDGDLQHAYAKPDGSPSTGTNAIIEINPTLTTYAVGGEKELPWMTERVQFGLYHELIHAWHIQHGTLARGDHNGVDNAEWQAVGLGPYASSPITENKIREQLGKDIRPDVDRKTY